MGRVCTYRPRPMQHADAKIPQADPAVLTHAPEAIVALVAAPGVKGDRGDPRVVALAAGDEGGRLGRAPDGDAVVLPSCHHVFAVGRPANAAKAAVVGVVEVEESVWGGGVSGGWEGALGLGGGGGRTLL